jgi:hypothetical protein
VAIAAEQPLDAGAHFLGRLVREGDREHLARPRVSLANEVSDAMDDDARLAGAGAGQDEQRTVHVEHGLALLGVQLGEMVHEKDRDEGCGLPAPGFGPVEAPAWSPSDRLQPETPHT